MADTYRRITLVDYPVGKPTADTFKIVEDPVPSPGEGEVLARTIYMSLDPYMRGRMSPAKSYADPVKPGDTMVGGAVAQVVASEADGLSAGDYVLCGNGWSEMGVHPAGEVRKIDPSVAPLSTWNGIMGMPGCTAYIGLLLHGKPQPGETVVVAAASGAVGSAVGQIAKIKGCRAVGVAGSDEKCKFVVEELGFDACVNYKSPTFAEDLAAAVPNGIDVYFENVAGKVLHTVLPHMNPFSRMPVCGIIAHYNATSLPDGPDYTPMIMGTILRMKISVRGFIVWDHRDMEEQALSDIAGWIKSGELKYKEDIVEGLDAAPDAFIGLLEGKNFGKLSVRLSDDPTL